MWISKYILIDRYLLHVLYVVVAGILVIRFCECPFLAKILTSCVWCNLLWFVTIWHLNMMIVFDKGQLFVVVVAKEIEKKTEKLNENF